MKYLFCLFIFILPMLQPAMAQDAHKQNLYCVFDLNKNANPAIDIAPETDNGTITGIAYSIKMPSLIAQRNKFNISFLRSASNAGTALSTKQYKKTKFITLASLTKLIADNGPQSFADKYNVFFIEPVNSYYSCNYVQMKQSSVMDNTVALKINTAANTSN